MSCIWDSVWGFLSLFFSHSVPCPPPFTAANLRPGAEQKVVFITARVHPGETPSSFVCQGECLHEDGRSDEIWSPVVHMLGLHSFASHSRLSSRDSFFHSEDISRISLLCPATCLLGGNKNILPLSLVNVCWTSSELNSGLCSCSGRIDSRTRVYAMQSCKASFLRKIGWKSSGSGSLLSAYIFLLSTIFSFFFTTKQWP